MSPLFNGTWIFLIFCTFVVAQDAAKTPSCTFSCPPSDVVSQPLVKRQYAVGPDSFFSVFECMYKSPNSHPSEHKCSYLKTSGLQLLGAEGDHCPAKAVPCSKDPITTESMPLFSQDTPDVPPWIEGSRYLLYLKEHNPQ